MMIRLQIRAVGSNHEARGQSAAGGGSVEQLPIRLRTARYAETEWELERPEGTTVEIHTAGIVCRLVSLSGRLGAKPARGI